VALSRKCGCKLEIGSGPLVCAGLGYCRGCFLKSILYERNVADMNEGLLYVNLIFILYYS
jgi:hypothetical protein